MLNKPLLITGQSVREEEENRKKEEYLRDAIHDHMHMNIGCSATLLERFQYNVEEYKQDSDNTNSALRYNPTPKLIRHANALSRHSRRMSEAATFLEAVYNQRPYVKQ